MKHLLDRIAVLVPRLEGWCPVEKAQWLAKWIVGRRACSVVEIGVFGGRSLVPMGLAMKFLANSTPHWPGRVIGFDPYDNETVTEFDQPQEHVDWWSKVDLKGIQHSAQEAIIREGVGAWVDIKVAKANECLDLFGDGTLDLIHIDGDHSEGASCRDVALWVPKLRVGGALVMDDTNWPTVQKARRMAAEIGPLVASSEGWEAFQKSP